MRSIKFSTSTSTNCAHLPSCFLLVELVKHTLTEFGPIVDGQLKNYLDALSDSPSPVYRTTIDRRKQVAGGCDFSLERLLKI